MSSESVIKRSIQIHYRHCWRLRFWKITVVDPSTKKLEDDFAYVLTMMPIIVQNTILILKNAAKVISTILIHLKPS